MKRTMKGIYSGIVEDGEISQDYKKSSVTLIHKGRGKAKDENGNYRPISIMNVLAKCLGW